MFTVYYSNQLEKQKDILAFLLEQLPPSDPFQSDIILVQSPGMAQWLQMELAKKNGIAANLEFPMPASFVWQLYADNLPEVSLQNPFDKDSMMWRLMRLIPTFLSQDDFAPLRRYLESAPHSEQYKRYQLCSKIADLFDQYLVYRPEWIFAWEKGEDEVIAAQIKAQQTNLNPSLLNQIQTNVTWQGTLWRALTIDVKTDIGSQATHRAALHEQFLTFLKDKHQPKKLPARVFVLVFQPCQMPIYRFCKPFPRKRTFTCFLIIRAKNIGAIFAIYGWNICVYASVIFGQNKMKIARSFQNSEWLN